MRNDDDISNYKATYAEYKKLSLMREEILGVIEDYKAEVAKELPNLSSCEVNAIKKVAVPLVKIKKLMEKYL